MFIGPRKLAIKPRVQFKSLQEVATWVAHGGEPALRELLARESVSAPTRQIADTWLTIQAGRRADEHAAESLETDKRAANAAEDAAWAAKRSARYAMWSALIATVAAVVALAAYFKP
jgi:hypothetical protein